MEFYFVWTRRRKYCLSGPFRFQLLSSIVHIHIIEMTHCTPSCILHLCLYIYFPWLSFICFHFILFMLIFVRVWYAIVAETKARTLYTRRRLRIRLHLGLCETFIPIKLRRMVTMRMSVHDPEVGISNWYMCRFGQIFGNVVML